MNAGAHRRDNTGPFEPLRGLKRKLKTRENHPHYVGNNNESLRLDQVVDADPPDGGMTAYVEYLDKDSRS
jgi:hypothetical protein